MVLVMTAALEKTGDKHQQNNIFLKAELKEEIGKNAETIGI